MDMQLDKKHWRGNEMLKKFEVQNFKGFKKKLVFDLAARDYVFNKTDCEVLEVGHHAGNIASKRVIEHCGFIFDGRLCKYKKLYDGRLIDADFYSMTIEDYERKKNYE